MSRNGFGEMIDQLCKAYSLSNKAFAEKCGIDAPSATRIRKGETKPVSKVKLIMKHLPKDEPTRARLQIELMLDSLGDYGSPSPMIEMNDGLAIDETIEQRLKQAAVPRHLKETFLILLDAALSSPHFAQSMDSLARQLTEWGVSKKYPIHEPQYSLVAQPQKKKKASPAKKKAKRSSQ